MGKTVGDDSLKFNVREILRKAKSIDGDIFKGPLTQLKVPKMYTLDQSDLVGKAVDILKNHSANSIAITQQSKLTGILTERDIIKKVIGVTPDYINYPIVKCMTPTPDALKPTDSIAQVIEKMHLGRYRHIPVVNNEHNPIAIISMRDLLKFICDNLV